jgi:hypothetical protein
MAGLESNEAFNLLRESLGEDERIAERKAQLADYARSILRQKGAFAFTKEGEYRTRHGRPGTGSRGVRLTQGTQPVRLGAGGDYIALRDSEQEKPVVELVMTYDGSAKGTYRAGPLDVLVSFEPKSLTMRGISRIENAHLDAVKVLLESVDHDLEPLVFSVEPKLPHVYYRNEYVGGQIIELRNTPTPDTIDG